MENKGTFWLAVHGMKLNHLRSLAHVHLSSPLLLFLSFHTIAINIILLPPLPPPQHWKSRGQSKPRDYFSNNIWPNHESYGNPFFTLTEHALVN